jgi:hypothetical protein
MRGWDRILEGAFPEWSGSDLASKLISLVEYSDTYRLSGSVVTQVCSNDRPLGLPRDIPGCPCHVSLSTPV